MNIADRLAESAARFPDKPAVIWPRRRRLRAADHESISFRAVNELVDASAAALSNAGIRRSMLTLVMIRPGRDFFAVTFALFRIGAVPVLIDPGMGRAGMARCIAQVGAQALVGIPLAQLFRLTHPRAFRTVRTSVTVDRRWAESLPRAPSRAADTSADDAAAILFTSGSTGPAKGVMYTHGVFEAQVRCLESHFGYAPDETDLATFPLFALFDVALGMTAVIPDMDASRPGRADPRKLAATIARFGCTHMFGSPALLGRLADHCSRAGIRLSGLKRILTAGAPIRPELLARVRAVVPDSCRIHTPYGATEALPVSDITDAEILSNTAHETRCGAGNCVGRPLAGLDVRVIEIGDRPIARWCDTRACGAGEIGEIVVKGPIATRTYHRLPDATAAAKINDPRDGGVWHRMGDVGYFDSAGRLWYCGRKSQRVTTAGGALFTEPCEAIFNQHAAVERTALVGVGPAGGQRPVLCVELKPAEKRRPRGGRKDDVRAELLEIAAAHESTRGITTVLFARRFPVDVRHNAKIVREKLAAWAAKHM
ncbi:Long-chain-fatty-acid--CoA ligase [Phycisphaerae bacterium RAS1]|nr:Long-chain-fatty-acid--CoA ligase [Phycisphaerae bacterium RAS1]